MKAALAHLALRALLAVWDRFWPEPAPPERTWSALIGSPVPDLDPDLTYEECPACRGAGGGCITCWDSGLIEHTHETLED